MYTITPNNDNKHFQIQICTWYIKYVLSAQYPTTAALQQGFFDKLKAKGANWAAKTIYKPIDSFSLTDKVFLHEVSLIKPRLRKWTNLVDDALPPTTSDTSRH
jgi:hypothetical protein